MIAAPWVSEDGRSGFTTLVNGSDALSARLALIDTAERRVDLQSFLVKPGVAARLITERLIAAADRGVQVRMLIDDVLSRISDRQLADLDAHPQIAVRVFNPLPRGLPKTFGFLLAIPRSNRRMHNKSLVVDGAIAIVGGRNLSDEYFEIDPRTEFADLDMLAHGPIAAEVASAFDLFWNDAFARPLASFARPFRSGARSRPPNLAPVLPAEMQRFIDAARDGPLLADRRTGRVLPESASARVVTDRPEKLRRRRGRGEQRLFHALTAELAAARHEAVFVTPYFVPRAEGVEALSALCARGVGVTVITNSLAATNHIVVHGGYAPYRRELLRAGVRLFEARPDTAISRLTGETVGYTLHSKLAIIDRRRIMVGSLNLDPRSTELNAELGIFIDSPLLSERLARTLAAMLPQHAYSVGLDGAGQLTWAAGSGADKRVWRREPGASVWRRSVAGLVARLPLVENQF